MSTAKNIRWSKVAFSAGASSTRWSINSMVATIAFARLSNKLNAPQLGLPLEVWFANNEPIEFFIDLERFWVFCVDGSQTLLTNIPNARCSSQYVPVHPLLIVPQFFSIGRSNGNGREERGTCIRPAYRQLHTIWNSNSRCPGWDRKRKL